MELKAKDVQNVISGKRWRNFQPIPHTARLKGGAIADVRNVTALKQKRGDWKNHESL